MNASYDGDIDRLLRERFSQRALLADPVADPGSRIMARAAAALARRRRRRVTLSASAGLVAVLGVVALSHSSSSSRVSTADSSTTTAGPSGLCSVADLGCTPSSVTGISVTGLPPGYQAVSPNSTTAAGDVEADYISTTPPTSGIGTQTLRVDVLTQSAADTKALVQSVSVAPYTAVTVSGRPGHLLTSSQGAGTAVVRTQLLVVPISDTVLLEIHAPGTLTAADLAALASSITVQS